mmetsp:Transcript_13086/g.41447  ORF Transcript_13086/g.41447 Transcript_13086/m.41447 type:complete len:422 (+) Transcript_13086:679-1944(+)
MTLFRHGCQRRVCSGWRRSNVLHRRACGGRSHGLGWVVFGAPHKRTSCHERERLRTDDELSDGDRCGVSLARNKISYDDALDVVDMVTSGITEIRIDDAAVGRRYDEIEIVDQEFSRGIRHCSGVVPAKDDTELVAGRGGVLDCERVRVDVVGRCDLRHGRVVAIDEERGLLVEDGIHNDEAKALVVVWKSRGVLVCPIPRQILAGGDDHSFDRGSHGNNGCVVGYTGRVVPLAEIFLQQCHDSGHHGRRHRSAGILINLTRFCRRVCCRRRRIDITPWRDHVRLDAIVCSRASARVRGNAGRSVRRCCRRRRRVPHAQPDHARCFRIRGIDLDCVRGVCRKNSFDVRLCIPDGRVRATVAIVVLGNLGISGKKRHGDIYFGSTRRKDDCGIFSNLANFEVDCLSSLQGSGEVCADAANGL